MGGQSERNVPPGRLDTIVEFSKMETGFSNLVLVFKATLATATFTRRFNLIQLCLKSLASGGRPPAIAYVAQYKTLLLDHAIILKAIRVSDLDNVVPIFQILNGLHLC